MGTPEEDQPLGCSLFVGGLPTEKDGHYLTDSGLKKLFVDAGFDAIGAEIGRNPDRSARSFGVVEFGNKREAQRALGEWTEQPFIGFDVYLKHLPMMVFPGVIGDCCSVFYSKLRPLVPKAPEQTSSS